MPIYSRPEDCFSQRKKKKNDGLYARPLNEPRDSVICIERSFERERGRKRGRKRPRLFTTFAVFVSLSA
jgi:hypothetical protein